MEIKIFLSFIILITFSNVLHHSINRIRQIIKRKKKSQKVDNAKVRGGGGGSCPQMKRTDKKTENCVMSNDNAIVDMKKLTLSTLELLNIFTRLIKISMFHKIVFKILLIIVVKKYL